MSKVIFFLLLIVALYVLVRTKRRRDSPGPDAPRGHEVPDTFVTCAYCGVNLPSSEAVTAEGRSYCCEEHRRRG